MLPSLTGSPIAHVSSCMAAASTACSPHRYVCKPRHEGTAPLHARLCWMSTYHSESGAGRLVTGGLVFRRTRLFVDWLRGASKNPLGGKVAGRCLSCFGRVDGRTHRKRKGKRLGLGPDRGVMSGESLTLGLTRATLGGYLFRPAFYGLGCRCLLYSTRNFVY